MKLNEKSVTDSRTAETRGCDSVQRLVRHSRPVNMQAAKIFWKAPWWAKLPPEDKEEMIHTVTKLENLVDVYQPPPQRPGGRHNQIPDLRGTKVRHKKQGIVALVLGYAYAKASHLTRGDQKRELWWTGNGWATATTKGNLKHVNEQRWYAFFEGDVQIIKSRNWAMAGNYEPITPMPNAPDQARRRQRRAATQGHSNEL